MRSKRMVGATAALLLVAVAAACGSDDGSSSTTPTAATTTRALSSTSPPPPTEPLVGESMRASSSPADSPTDAEAWEGETAPAAQAEGTVVWYSTATPEVNEAIVRAFTERFPGIAVEVQRGLPAELVQRIEAEQSADLPSADVFGSVGEGWTIEAVEQGALARLESPRFQALPAEWRFGDDQAAYVRFVPHGLGWNTDAIEQLSDLDAALSADVGPIGVLDPTVSPIYAPYYLALEKQFGDDVIARLAGHDHIIYPGTLPMGQALAANEIDVAVAMTPTTLTMLQGAPIALDYSVSPTPVIGSIVQVLGAARHPRAAQLFASFVLSPEVQQVYADEGVLSVLDEFRGGTDGVDVNALALLDPAEYSPDEVAAVVERWKSAFG